MKQWPQEHGKQRYILTDLDGNEIRTTDPIKVTSEMWAKFWPVPPIGEIVNALKNLSQGDSILLEDVGIEIYKCYRIV